MKKHLLWLLAVVMCFSLFTMTPTTTGAADVTERYIFAAETLPEGEIGVLFVYGGTSNSGVVTGGNLYFGTYNPTDNSWDQQQVGAGTGAKDAAMALDSAGNPHVVYVTADDKLAYTYLSDLGWTTEEVIESIAFGGVVGALTSPDIAIDSNGYAHISYMDAKGGNGGGWYDYSSYDTEDLVYANNTDGSFEKVVISYSHGYFYSPDGYRNQVSAPPKITLIDDAYYIGVKQYQFEAWQGGRWHTHSYDLLFEGGHIGYEISSSSQSNARGFKLFEIVSIDNAVYSLFSKDGMLRVTEGAVEIPETIETFSAVSAHMTVSEADIYYAALSNTMLLFYQDGDFIEDTGVITAPLANHPRMATVVTGGNQYVLYTGNDSEKSLIVASIPVGGGELTEYKVPNKTAVTIGGVSIDNKEYDGLPVTLGGELVVSGADLTESDLLYTYSGTGLTDYSASPVPPTDAGTYQLVISVPDENEIYTGASIPINFTITKKEITVTGTVAVERNYIPENLNIDLNTGESILSGLVAADEGFVTLNKAAATGTVATADAGDAKVVNVSGFALLGTKADNYILIQPTGLTVNIIPAKLLPPTVTLTTNSPSGGLSAIVHDNINVLGIIGYDLLIYKEGVDDVVKLLFVQNKSTLLNIPLENGVIEAGNTYIAKARAVADNSDNYHGSALGDASLTAFAAYEPLVFIDSDSYNIPTSKVGQAITPIDVTESVNGGKLPYTYSAVGLPDGILIDEESGLISGLPAAVSLGGNATITATDAQAISQSIVISYDEVEKGDALEFTGTAPTATKTYGDPVFDIGGLSYDGDNGTVSYSLVSGPGSLSGTELTITGAGTIVVKAIGSSVNYEEQTANYMITVNKKPVTITPVNAENTKIYGDPDPVLSYTHSALVGEDSLAGNVITRLSGEVVGEYAISLDPILLNDANYEFTLAAGNYFFAITQKSLTINGAVISEKIYDGTTDINLSHVTNITFDGLVNNETLSSGTDYLVTAASYTDDAYVGVNKATSITVTLKDTNIANNYKFINGTGIFTGAVADIVAAAQQPVITPLASLTKGGNTLDLQTLVTNAQGVVSFMISAPTNGCSINEGILQSGDNVGIIKISVFIAAKDLGGEGDNPEYAAYNAVDAITINITDKEIVPLVITQSDTTYGSTLADPCYSEPSGTLITTVSYEGTLRNGATYSGKDVPTDAGTYKVTVSCETATHIYEGTSAVFSINPLDISDAVISLSPGLTYNGESQTQGISAVQVGDLAVASDVYEVTNNTQTNAGTYTLTVTAKNTSNFSGSADKLFTIAKKDIAQTMIISVVGSYYYNGSAIEPNFVVKEDNTSSANILTDSDYAYEVSNNINAGSATLTITSKEDGNYDFGVAETGFDILKVDYTGSIFTIKDVFVNKAQADVEVDMDNLLSDIAGAEITAVNIYSDTHNLIENLSFDGNIVKFDVRNNPIVDATATLSVTSKSTNYNPFIAIIIVKAVDKIDAEVSFADAIETSKVYGDEDFSVIATAVNVGDNGSWSFSSSNPAVLNIESTLDATATVKILKSGNATITARYESDTTLGEITSAITVAKADLVVQPKSMDIYIGDPLPIPVVEYVGLKYDEVGTDVATLSSGNLNMEIKNADETGVLTDTDTSGVYKIVFSEGPIFNNSDKYNIIVNEGTLTISKQTVPAANGAVSVEYDTSNDTAILELPLSKVDEIIEKSLDDVAIIDLSALEDIASVEIPSLALSAFAEAGFDISLQLPKGTIILDAEAAGDIVEQANGSDLKIELKEIDAVSLTEAQQQAIKSDDLVVDINIYLGTEKVTEFNGILTVQFPYDGPLPVAVWYLNDDGNLEELTCVFKNGVVSFDLNHLSLYVIGQSVVWENTFIDVKEDDWFYGAVEYVYKNDLMIGTSNNRFSPHVGTTRAMIVTILHRLENTPAAGTPNPFSDVAKGKWYTDAIIWAAEGNIVKGYGNGKFGPNDLITREQAAVIFYRYAEYKGYDVSARANLAEFSDVGSVSSWALKALSWANATDLIQGMDGKILAPKGNAQRCQIAAILQRFLEPSQDR
ncbi:MAG: S-layer homology domain-containing protein [Bacillota bacterium]